MSFNGTLLNDPVPPACGSFEVSFASSIPLPRILQQHLFWFDMTYGIDVWIGLGLGLVVGMSSWVLL